VVFILDHVQTHYQQRQKCRQIAGGFNHHADTAVQSRVHQLIELIQGSTRSHWVLPLGKCLHSIDAMAAKVINFEKHRNTNKTQLLASQVTVDPAKSHENFRPRIGPPIHLNNVKVLFKLNSRIKAEELRYILSYQTLSKA
jgi:hypothetical protein